MRRVGSNQDELVKKHVKMACPWNTNCFELLRGEGEGMGFVEAGDEVRLEAAVKRRWPGI